jgi:hypothetical protein
VSGGHLEFLRQFEVLFLKIHTFLWSRLPKYVIRSNLNLIAHEMTIDLPINVSFTKQSYFECKHNVKVSAISFSVMLEKENHCNSSLKRYYATETKVIRSNECIDKFHMFEINTHYTYCG